MGSKSTVSDGRGTGDTDHESSEGDSATETEQHHLQQIFERVTGTAEFVTCQETAVDLRCLDNEDVSEYVTTAAQTDGLSDAVEGSEAAAETED